MCRRLHFDLEWHEYVQHASSSSSRSVNITMIGTKKRKRVYASNYINQSVQCFRVSNVTNEKSARDQPSKRFCRISSTGSETCTAINSTFTMHCRDKTGLDDLVIVSSDDVINAGDTRECVTCKKTKSIADQFQARDGNLSQGTYKRCLDCRKRDSSYYECKKEKLRPIYEALQNAWLGKFRDDKGVLRCACGKVDCWNKGRELLVSEMERDHLIEKLKERGMKKIALDLGGFAKCSQKDRAKFHVQFECSQPLHAMCHARITRERLIETRIPDSELSVQGLSNRHKSVILGMIKCGELCLHHAIEQANRKCKCMGRSLSSFKGRCTHCVPVACNCEAAKSATCAGCGKKCTDRKWRSGFHLAHVNQDRTYSQSIGLAELSTVNQVSEIRKTCERWLCTVCHSIETKYERRTATASIPNTRRKKRSQSLLTADQRDWIMSYKGKLTQQSTADLFQQTWNRSVSQRTVSNYWNKA